MATKSRTYLPTDWKVWTYTPVANKFRLDFSTLNGSDVLGGSSDLGSIQVLDLDINSIQLDDGQRPDQGVFFSFTPATMSLSAQLMNWSDTIVKELYNGKQIFLTLKNEADNSHPTFGKNTVFFIGQIDFLDITVDPINQVTNLVITATDVSGAAVNTPIAVSKGTSKGYAIQQGFLAAQTAGTISPYLDFSLFALLGTSWETGGTYSTTFGELMAEYISAEVAQQVNNTFQSWDGSDVIVYRQIYGGTIASTLTTGRLIPESLISNIVIEQDGANSPTAYELANSAASYSYGTASASTLTNPTIYTATLDVPTSSLQIIANKISEFTQKIQPVEVTVKTATTYQTITFSDSVYGAGDDYFYPQYHFKNAEDVKTTPTFTGGTYYHTIVGTSHTITPDDWQTTYQLWKGL
jgi:hypothetical protein